MVKIYRKKQKNVASTEATKKQPLPEVLEEANRLGLLQDEEGFWVCPEGLLPDCFPQDASGMRLHSLLPYNVGGKNVVFKATMANYSWSHNGSWEEFVLSLVPDNRTKEAYVPPVEKTESVTSSPRLHTLKSSTADGAGMIPGFYIVRQQPR